MAVRRDQSPFYRRKEVNTKHNLLVVLKDSGRAETPCFRGYRKTTVLLES